MRRNVVVGASDFINCAPLALCRTGTIATTGGLWSHGYRRVIRRPQPDLLHSGPLFMQHRCGPSSFNKFEAAAYVGRARNVANAFNPLELNLFDDPTGGLTAGPAEELPAADIASQVRLCVATYSRSHFYLLFTPLVDVVSIILQRGLTPNAPNPSLVMARWFTDAVVTLQNPSWMEEAMGSSAWNQLCDGLDQLYEDVEPVMPLTAAVRKHGLPEQILVPFVRQLALEMLLPTRRRAVVEILPGLILGLANGRAPPELGFPEATGTSASNSFGAKGGAEEAQRRRAIMAADLFLGVGQETGNTDFAYLGIQLLRANDIPVPFPKQKQLTNVFSAATRIQTDWQMRVSGQLVEVLPKWMDYYKTVYNDNIQAMKRLNEKEGSAMAKASQKADAVKREKMPHGGIHLRNENDRAGGSYRGEENVDGVHDYFSSHRDENMDRLADLEKRIEECVRKRDVDWRLGNEHLYSRFKRKKSPLTENPSKATESTGKAAVDGDGDRDDTDEEIL